MDCICYLLCTVSKAQETYSDICCSPNTLAGAISWGMIYDVVGSLCRILAKTKQNKQQQKCRTQKAVQT